MPQTLILTHNAIFCQSAPLIHMYFCHMVIDSLILSSLCFQAAHYLHEEAARYPRKIHYHNPPDLAMEALEVSHLWFVSCSAAERFCFFLFLSHYSVLMSGDPIIWQKEPN